VSIYIGELAPACLDIWGYALIDLLRYAIPLSRPCGVRIDVSAPRVKAGFGGNIFSLPGVLLNSEVIVQPPSGRLQ